MLNFITAIAGGFADIIGAIVNTIALAVNAAISGIIQKLPDGGGLPQGVHDAAIYFGNALGKVSFFFPTDVLIYCLALILTLKITLYGFHFLLWIVNLIRGVSTPRYNGYM